MKNALRQEIISQCKSLTSQYRNDASNQISQNCQNLILNAENIGIYRSFSWEISLNNLIKKCLLLQKKLYQPIAFRDNKLMLFEPYNADKTDIFTDKVQPSMQDLSIKWYNLDLIFLPLVAVDNCGYRLGKGGGYYDSTLSQIKKCENPPILCGVGYNCQMVGHIPKDEWDIQLDYFVSEHGLTKFK